MAYLHFVTLLPTALVPAAGEDTAFVATGAFVAAFLVIHLLIGSVDIFAKLGANQMLNPNLNGRSAFVIAYAVATLVSLSASIPLTPSNIVAATYSTSNLTPSSPLGHHFASPFLFSSFSNPSPSASLIHPLRLKYLPNFSTPSLTQ